MRFLPAFVLCLCACAQGDQRSSDSATGGVATRTSSATLPAGAARNASTTAAAGDTAAPVRGRGVRAGMPAIVRGIYVNRHQAQSAKRMKQLIAIADSTEINGMVIDIKDEFGLNYVSKDPTIVRNAGRMGAIPNLERMLDTLRAHGIVSIARLVVFKDSVAARVNPEHTMRKADGTPWRDKQGLAWVNPYDRTIWEYNIRVAEEMARLGFDEIQFDYIRFPEPYPSLPKQHFPGANGVPKPQILADFLKTACGRINALGARCTADIFGLVTTVRGALEIGQEWEKVSPVVDVVLPMTYPSHYPRGSFGVDRPNADPETIQRVAIAKARERDQKLGITEPEHVRPWIQAFTLGKPPYGPAEIQAQKRGIYAAGYEGWILWHPGSKYEQFVPGLERTLERRVQRETAAPANGQAR